MFRKEEREGRIRGISICSTAPWISHLMFADDCIIFRNATGEEGARVLKILGDYEKNSGQKLNKDKTSLFFSKNTESERREAIKGMLGAQIIQQHKKYLGLPPLIGKGKRKSFNKIKDQVGRRIAGWKGKLLSSAGQEILFKVVAQATPTYTMSFFQLPDSLCKELNSMVSGFWWGQRNKERKMVWVAWEKMCTPKAKGGMGFKDLKAFNFALLAKQGWQILSNPSSLNHKVLKAKYFAKSNFMEA